MSLSSLTLSRYRYRLCGGQVFSSSSLILPKCFSWPEMANDQCVQSRRLCWKRLLKTKSEAVRRIQGVTLSVPVLPLRTHTPEVCVEAALFAYRGLIHLQPVSGMLEMVMCPQWLRRCLF